MYIALLQRDYIYFILFDRYKKQLNRNNILKFNRNLISYYLYLLNLLLLCYVFGRAFLVSMFEPGKHYVTKKSALLITVLISTLIALILGSRIYPSTEGIAQRKLLLSLIMNSIFLLLAFLMLLEGVLIV